jgi:hypothetical protein
LDDASEGELDVNDVAIEVAAGKIHGTREWRAWRDLNPQPSDPKSEALSG